MHGLTLDSPWATTWTTRGRMTRCSMNSKQDTVPASGSSLITPPGASNVSISDTRDEGIGHLLAALEVLFGAASK